MWTTVQDWQLSQLARLAQVDPDRVNELLNHLYAIHPTLLIDLAIMAVDHEQLTVTQCADVTGLTEEQVEQQLQSFRSRSSLPDKAVVIDPERNIARLSEGQVPVWEVVRVFRRHGSIPALSEAFPSLSVRELMAALRYAEEHAEEIEDQIEKYEGRQIRRQIEYPFAS